MPSADNATFWIPSVNDATNAYDEASTAFDEANERVMNALQAYRDSLQGVQRAKGMQNVGIGRDKWTNAQRVAAQNAANAKEELADARAAAQSADERLEQSRRLLNAAKYQDRTGKTIDTESEFEEAAESTEDASEGEAGIVGAIAGGLEDIASIF